LFSPDAGVARAERRYRDRAALLRPKGSRSLNEAVRVLAADRDRLFPGCAARTQLSTMLGDGMTGSIP